LTTRPVPAIFYPIVAEKKDGLLMTQNSQLKAKLEDVTNVTGHLFFPIIKPIINIGSSLENDLVIEKNTISDQHATIKRQPDGHFVVIQSSYGKTLLNGTELEPNSPYKLNDGDEIRIDTFAFIFKLEKIELPQTAPAPQSTIVLEESMLPDDSQTADPTDTIVLETSMLADDSQTADPEDTIVLEESMLPDDSQTADPAEPEPDTKAEPGDEEIAHLDSDALMEALFAADQVQPEPEPEPESEPVPETGTEAELEPDATVFFDSGSLLDELQEAEPSQPEPEPEPEAEAEADPDEDDTVFFDSGSLMDELQEAEPSQPEPEPARDEKVARKEPAAPSEIKKIGKYEVIKLLGKGGFGSVWKAQAPDGQPVAIKVLNPDVVEDERAVRKFYHEAINLSKMDHPNICRFIDFFPHEGNPAIIMDFVQGTNLRDMLGSQKGPLPLDTARQIASQALDGLHYAHQKQVLHRDIKPENITLTTEGSAKIMDFGIASLSSTESQQTSLFMISPAYTAPERFDPSKTDLVDHRADIYALGLVFYEIFTGKHPFPKNEPVEMMMAQLKKVPTPPNEIVDLPLEINESILIALEKDPDDRFEDFAAFKMEMLGEAPRRSSDTIGPIEFSGASCKNSAALLKTLSGHLKKHQKQATKITLGQVGEQVNLVIETIGGNVMTITWNME
jgi:serine/threonine protein kinase/pSer/pThr/pTyr-binding forkhead associated (FHA) protein